MTVEKMKQIINTQVPFSKLIKNEGILIFYVVGIVSVGISYEDDNEGNEYYIYNLFLKDDEYINICGSSNKEELINKETLNELVVAWNRYIK